MHVVLCGFRRLVQLEEPEQGRSEAKVFRGQIPPNGVCENLVCALQLMANQQLGGDSLVQVLDDGLQERCRSNIMDELRRFITVDNQRGCESRL